MKKIIILTVLCLLYAAGFFSSHPKAEAAFWDVLDPWSIPLYPALQKINEQTVIINDREIKMIVLSGRDISMPNIVEYYKMTLAQKGWGLQEEKSLINGVVTLEFLRDGQQLIVDFFSREFTSMLKGKAGVNESLVRVTQIKGKENYVEQVQRVFAQDQDRPGEDFAWLKRYPKSVRLSSMKMPESGFMSAYYKVADYSCLQCVADFYTEQMLEQGWRLFSSSEKAGGDLQTNDKSFAAIEERLAKINETLGVASSLPHFSKDELKKILGDQLPDMVKTILFQKGGQLCSVVITYTGERPEQAKQYQDALTKQLQQAMAGAITQNNQPSPIVSEMVNAQSQQMTDAFSSQFQERIEIGIQYIPKEMFQGRRLPS